MRANLSLRRKLTNGLLVVGVSMGAAIFCTYLTTEISAILVASVLVACISCCLMQHSAGLFDLRALNIPALWFWLYLTFVFIPALFVFQQHGEPYRTRYLIGVESVAITVPLGVVLANLSCRFTKQETAAYFSRPIGRDGSHRRFLIAFLLLFCIAGVLAVFYVVQVRSLPLYDLLVHPGEYNMLVLAREQSLKLMNSPLVYAYYVLRSTLYPLLILVALGRYLATRHLIWGVLLALSLASGLVYSALTIAKAPVSNLVLFVAVFLYLYHGGRVSLKSSVLALSLFFFFPIFVVMWEQAGVVDFWATLTDLGHRLFVEPAEVLYYYFEVFPQIMPHQHGATIGKLAWILGISNFDDANFVGRYMMARGSGFRSSVTANAPFMGSLYTDFGLGGVFLGGVLAGSIMQAFQIYIVRRPKTTLNLALLSFLLVTFVWLNVTALPIVLLSDGALLVLVFASILREIDRQLGPPAAAARLHTFGPHAGRTVLSG